MQNKNLKTRDETSGIKVSIFGSCINAEVKNDVPLYMVLKSIKEADLNEIEECRKFYLNKDKEEFNRIKTTKIPAFTPSGTFEGTRKKENLKEYSKSIILDFDNLISEEIEELKIKIGNIPFTYSCFKSVSNRGLKAIVKVNTESIHHEIAFEQTVKYYEFVLGIEVDKSGKDISRLCIFSNDKDLYLNEEAKVFQVKIPEIEENKITDAYGNIFRKCLELTHKISEFQEGNRNNFVHLLANNCNRQGIPKKSAIELIKNSKYNYKLKEVVSAIISAYNNEDQFKSYSQNVSFDKNSIDTTFEESNFFITGEELLSKEATEIPTLLDPLFPKVGVICLGGGSDTGKSSFLRQLQISIVSGEDSFLGFKLNTIHKSAIYLSTEDDEYAMRFLLNKQNTKEYSKECFRDLRYIFDSDNALQKIENLLKEKPADCVVVDAFADIYKGAINSTNEIRNFINDYSNLAKKHQCLIIFLHHTGKNKENDIPSKNNLLGSQGFEAKMRLVLELRKDFSDVNKRHLCVVKGNYLKAEHKERSYVLKFDENMCFSITDERVDFNKLSNPDYLFHGKSEIKEKAIAYLNEGKSYREVSDQLSKDGIDVSKSTIGNWAKDCPVVQPPSKLDGGQTIV